MSAQFSDLASTCFYRRTLRINLVRFYDKKAFACARSVFHPGRNFLADIATLVKTDATQFLEPCVEREYRVWGEIGAR